MGERPEDRHGLRVLSECAWLRGWQDVAEQLDAALRDLLDAASGMAATDVEVAYLEGAIAMLRRMLASRRL